MGGKTHTPLWTRVLTTRYGQENSHLAMGEITHTPLWARVHIPTMSEVHTTSVLIVIDFISIPVCKFKYNTTTAMAS